MKISDYFVGLILVVLIIFFMAGSLMGSKTESQCENICEAKGAIYSETKQNGYFNLKDYCTCFFKDRTETEVLNDENNNLVVNGCLVGAPC
tara:strand:- start:9515 stop:9787 length:273 start_codon:yes stop_codon:yes gene_type:complete